jgi:hypothetical protein
MATVSAFPDGRDRLERHSMKRNDPLVSGLAVGIGLLLVASGCSADSSPSNDDQSPAALGTSPDPFPDHSESPTPRSPSTTPSTTPGGAQIGGPNRWEARLTRASEAVGVMDLESPELQPFSARMVGTWRDRAVMLAYYDDIRHAGAGRVIARITVGTVPAVLVDRPGTPAYLRMDCGDDHYEASVTRGRRLATTSTYDRTLTLSLATEIAQQVNCSVP